MFTHHGELMTLDKKKKAALAAVAACMKQGPMEIQPMTPPPLPGQNLWGQSGRLSGMEFRNIMQMKGLHRK